jgi:hypothetical protein
MRIQKLSYFAASAFLTILLTGCSALHVPRYGSATVTLIEGGMVETIVFDGGEVINMQITEEHMPENKYYIRNVLTIGEFSPIIGSGFTRRSNIYYESTIEDQGQAVFTAGKMMQYDVRWQEVDVITSHKNNMTSVYSVIVRQLDF